MNVRNCPGSSAPDAVRCTPEQLASALSSAVLAQVVRALAVRPMTYEELVWAVYGTGGPEGAKRVLRVVLCVRAHQLHPFGWRIVRPGHRRKVPLRLEPIPDTPAA